MSIFAIDCYNIITLGQNLQVSFEQDIGKPSKVAERKQSATSMPCVCCDSHTYGGLLFYRNSLNNDCHNE